MFRFYRFVFLLFLVFIVYSIYEISCFLWVISVYILLVIVKLNLFLLEEKTKKEIFIIISVVFFLHFNNFLLNFTNLQLTRTTTRNNINKKQILFVVKFNSYRTLCMYDYLNDNMLFLLSLLWHFCCICCS